MTDPSDDSEAEFERFDDVPDISVEPPLDSSARRASRRSDEDANSRRGRRRFTRRRAAALAVGAVVIAAGLVVAVPALFSNGDSGPDQAAVELTSSVHEQPSSRSMVQPMATPTPTCASRSSSPRRNAKRSARPTSSSATPTAASSVLARRRSRHHGGQRSRGHRMARNGSSRASWCSPTTTTWSDSNGSATGM